MENKLKYELNKDVVEYILNALNRVQIAGVQQAQSLIAVTEMLQNPLNKDDMEKEAYESLKEKFEQKKDK